MAPQPRSSFIIVLGTTIEHHVTSLSVFIEDDRSAHVNPPATINQNAGMEWATWCPGALMASYEESRSDTNLQTSMLHHITNFVARNHWNWKGNNADNVP